jgi:hypothetical protein
MVEFVSAVLACVDLAIKAGNAATQHVRTVRDNNNLLSGIMCHFKVLRASLSHMKADPKLNTRVWRATLESVKKYFTKASAELAKIGGSGVRHGASRILTPAAIASVLNGLVRDLQQVELLLLNLDGFANVGRQNKDLLIVARANKGLLEDVRVDNIRVATKLHDLNGNILEGHRRLDLILEMLSAMKDAQATPAVRLEDVVEAIKVAVFSRSADGNPARPAACTSEPRDIAGPARRGDGQNSRPASGTSNIPTTRSTSGLPSWTRNLTVSSPLCRRVPHHATRRP